MVLGIILLVTGFGIGIYFLITNRDPRTRRSDKTWSHQKKIRRVRAVGACAVAVGVYKTYEDRKRLEKKQSEYQLKNNSSE